MRWIVNKIPDQSLLNTAGWRFIIPQLYKKYPNDAMNLNISFSSPPAIRIAENDIDVLDSSEVIPVACISLVSLLMGEIIILIIFTLHSVCIMLFFLSISLVLFLDDMLIVSQLLFFLHHSVMLEYYIMMKGQAWTWGWHWLVRQVWHSFGESRWTTAYFCITDNINSIN
jgi:hypothetical protein